MLAASHVFRLANHMHVLLASVKYLHVYLSRERRVRMHVDPAVEAEFLRLLQLDGLVFVLVELIVVDFDWVVVVGAVE